MRRRYDIPLRAGGLLRLGGTTVLMGVLNVTPDSFSDGGKYLNVEAALEQGLNMVREGVDILDIGGESTRPGAEPISANEELERVIPVIEKLRAEISIPISIDTYKAQVAKEAIARGAEMVNDVSGFKFDEQLPEVVRETNAAVVLMHMRGTPQTMHRLPPSPDILREVKSDLANTVSKATRYGIQPEKIVIDPGIGFGKNTEANLKLINHLDILNELDRPILIGTSRKSLIGNILGVSPSERLMGTAATIAAAILRGAHIVRVHDVKPMKEVVKMVDAILMG